MERADEGGITSREALIVEQFGLDFERFGVSRSLGRLFGYLLLQERPRTQEEVARDLGLSKAMTSVTLRQAMTAGFARQVPVPGARRHHFELTPGWWVTSTLAQLQLVVAWKDLARRGIEAVGESGEDRPLARRRLEDMAAFFDYLEERFATLGPDFARYQAERNAPGPPPSGRD